MPLERCIIKALQRVLEQVHYAASSFSDSIGVDVECYSNDGIHCHELRTFEPIRLSILNQVVDNEDSDEHGDGLKRLEVKR